MKLKAVGLLLILAVSCTESNDNKKVEPAVNDTEVKVEKKEEKSAGENEEKLAEKNSLGFVLYQDMITLEDLTLYTPSIDGCKEKLVLGKNSKVKIIDISKAGTVSEDWVKVEVQKGAVDKDGNNVEYAVVGWCYGKKLKKTEAEKYTPDYADGNGAIISETVTSSGQTIVIRKHNQTVLFGDMSEGYVYSDIQKSETVYTLKYGDKIEISEIWDLNTPVENHHDVFYKVKVNDIEGFIEFFNPYHNNSWEIIETINSSGRKWTVRKLTDTLCVWSKDDDEVEIRDRPGKEGTNIIAYIPASYKNGQNQINIEFEAVTEELDEQDKKYRWVRFTHEGKTGWIYGGNLSAERGGPTYCIPELDIEFSLGDPFGDPPNR
ncbi:MAG: hypothetical protein IK002_03605 [Treponema sp.]|uniref:hypothetical protein n=1 Tax=Treponema sp. TaxID=166 RepID=UPI00298D9CAD|nr:hypothetical protein [Treponema sp.]MBR5933054.1 hypothetical protein [Treponema sp.]